MAKTLVSCPLCRMKSQSPFADVDGFRYFECGACDFIYVDPAVLARIDRGAPVRIYDRSYWEAELAAARERSFGASLARVAEVILYCRIPVERFVDLGTGPGYLLDAFSWALPSAREKVFGVELFPPEPHERTDHPNYVVGSLSAAGRLFQADCCIEVIEHLTPRMLRGLATELAAAATPGACFIFNTGLTDYVRHEDPGYLDPLRRGHICIWSVPAIRRIFKPPLFAVHAIPGKTWAFLVETNNPGAASPPAIADRIWTPCAENLRLLHDKQAGSLMYVLGIDTARAYRD